MTNVPGLAYFEGVLSTEECAAVVLAVEELTARGARGDLVGPTYTPIPAPFVQRKQSRVMLQFGAYTNANRVENVI